jgi:hypothetical protein
MRAISEIRKDIRNLGKSPLPFLPFSFLIERLEARIMTMPNSLVAIQIP